MTDTEAKPETKPPPDRPPMSIKSAAAISALVLLPFAAFVLIMSGSWLLLGGVAAGMTGTAYAAHRVKNPPKKGWPWTGNQSRRAQSKSGKSGSTHVSRRTTASGSRKTSGSSGLTASRGRARKGSLGSLLPTTTRSRAARSAGGALRKRKDGRSLTSSRTNGRSGRSAGTHPTPKGSSKSKPTGTKRPTTPSKTSPKPYRSPSLIPRGPRLSTPGRSSTSHRRTPLSRSTFPKGKSSKGGGFGLRGSTKPGSPSARSRPSTGSRGGSGSSTKRRPFSGAVARSPFRRKSPGGLPLSRSSRGSARRSLPKSRKLSGRRSGSANPLFRTSPSGQHRRLRRPFRKTRPMTKTGNPKRMISRDGVPRRSASRPRPYRRTPARRLLRLAVGLPVRGKKGRVSVPTAAQRRRARRTLRLRSLARLRALPRLLARLSWLPLDSILKRVPAAPDPAWGIAPPDPTPPTNPTPPTGPGLATVHPIRKAPATMDPVQNLIDAFHQLANYRPETAGDWERFLSSQAEIWQAGADAYTVLADNSRSGMDFDVNTAAGLDDVSAAVGAVSDIAQTAHQAFGHGS